MTHPLTVSAVTRAIEAIGTPVDLGMIFPPRPGEVRGRGYWQNRDLATSDVLALLPRACAANARGAHVYLRVRANTGGHPGVVLLDDVTAGNVARLTSNDFPPVLTVETSPGNFQVWIRLVPVGAWLSPELVQAALRHLIQTFDADPRAASAWQPGRVPGLTNRKDKYRQPNGLFPFVRVIHTAPGLVAPRAAALLAEIEPACASQARAGAGRRPEKAALSAPEIKMPLWKQLDVFRARAAKRIDGQLAAGRRPASSGSRSEIDFASAVEALAHGIDGSEIAAWLAQTRPDKDYSYAWRTVEAASMHLEGKSSYSPINPLG
ncbi:MAG: DNA-primase RepB domain-containing protein [Pseudorhodoplanes sp.]|nr:DNA-primase RepB domain-containing protein [Pseudorhodoplanes sp.]